MNPRPAVLAAVMLALLAGPRAGAGAAANEVLAAVQTKLTAGESLAEPTAVVGGLDSAELQVLVTELDRAWPGLRSRYLDALAAAGKSAGGASSERRTRIREQRAEFARVKQLGDDAMKAQLKSTSKPALDELRRLLTPTAEEMVQAAGDELVRMRRMTRELAGFRDAALDAALSTTPSDTVQELDAAERKAAEQAAGIDRDGLRILEKNRKLAENESVPADEAAGIEECNLWRLYVGLNALVLDPKLCEAARGHSQDMAERSFFAHESPVEGKHSFTDRARLAGTTASAENIYSGGQDPHGANTGWFFSPGHHKNMFAAGHVRIGLGHHQGRWTQMFGG